MFDELYPIEPFHNDHDKKYREEKFQSENYLRLASKYEAAFGYARLDTLIRNLNPDNDHLPGLLHQKLLELPWNDVFTTNYDTLLERTKVLDRTYHTVAHPSELPSALAPRIIKLHGSFTNTHRLVIAEEHYRTYPKDSAPFVNTVQQSLLENSFVLIGFSGDDPNFLAWTGWIRDELQDRHSSIYLVGPLDLSTTDRLLLKKRGVTPIDLYPMFDRNEHFESILWFLESLANAAPQRPENWLKLRLKKTFISSKSLVEDLNIVPSEPPTFEVSDGAIPPETLSKLMSHWAHERNSYPGWVIAPEQKRNLIWQTTKRWIPALQNSIEEMSSEDRMLCSAELIWRLNTSMTPLNQDFIGKFSEDIKSFHEVQVSKNFKTHGLTSKIFGSVSASRLLNTWIDLCLDTMREAREVYDQVRWDTTSQMLSEVLSGYQIKSDRYSYESLLNLAWNVKLTSATPALSAWQPSHNVPIAQIWKASLLAEVRKFDEALALLLIALNNIRKSAKNKSNNIELLSLEGWCTFLIAYVEMCIRSPKQETSDFTQRWQELKLWDCNPWDTRKDLEQALDSSPAANAVEWKITAGFDPRSNHVTKALRTSLEDVKHAFAYLRHFEQAGIPLFLANINITGKRLDKALQLTQPFTGFWSPALMVRARQIKQLTDNPEILSRTQIAMMDGDMAVRIHKWAIDIFEEQVNRYYQSTHQQILRDKLVLGIPELLSRLSFKLPDTELTYTFKVVLKIYSALTGVSAPGMPTTLNTWLNRIYHAATDQQLLDWLPELLKAPFRETNDSSPRDRDLWIDPMNSFPNRISLRNPSTISPEISSSISWLLAKIQSLNGESKSSAIWRLATLNSGNFLNREQLKHFKDLLWAGVSQNALPNDIHAFNYLHLPKRNERVFFDLFKKHLLNQPNESSLTIIEGRPTLSSRYEFPSSRLKTIAMSTKPAVQMPEEMIGLVSWQPIEAMDLLEELFAWWETVKSASLKFDTIQKTGGRWFGIFVARMTAPNIDKFPAEFTEKVFDWIIELRSYNIFATNALSIFYNKAPDKQLKIKEIILSDINSLDSNKVIAAAKATLDLHANPDNQELHTDKEMINTLIRKVGFRSEIATLELIQSTTYLFIKNSSFITQDNVSFICESLTDWASATDLKPPHISGFSVEVRPDLQAAIGTLAGTLSYWIQKNRGKYKKFPTLELWRDICETSCLPEVRRSFNEGIQYSLKKNQ